MYLDPGLARILIIDDSAVVCKSTELVLKNDGFNDIRFITNPLLAISTIQEYEPDLVLLDIEMPGLGGLELLTTIVELNLPPIVVMFSALDMKTKYKALEMGAFDFVNKMADPEELCVRVRHAIKNIGKHIPETQS